MKILLINPPMCVDQTPKIVPFGIAYVAQELKSNNFKVETLDIDGYRYSKDEVSSFIKKSDPDVIGIGGLATIYPYLDWLIPEIKKTKPGIPVILGGAIASSLKEKCFERFDIDFEVIGEGEVTIVKLLNEIAQKRNFASVEGIAYRDKGKIVFTKSRQLIESLGRVPIIDYSPFPFEKLLKNSQGILQIHCQRGCPGKCTFCFNCFRVISNAVRYRPVNNVIDEIQLFDHKYNVKLFNLTGECITFNKKWIIDFSKEILRRRLKIKYKVNSRVDTLDAERLKWLGKSGCSYLSLGIETGSQKILNIIQKGATVEQGKRAIRLAKKYIPRVEFSIIFGYAGENEDTIKETVEFVKEMKTRVDTFYYATAFPGTELYKMALTKGRIKDEEKYLMGIDRSSVINLSRYINLTDLEDDKFRILIKSSISEINRYFFIRELITLRLFRPILFKRLFLYYLEHGARKSVVKILEGIGIKK